MKAFLLRSFKGTLTRLGARLSPAMLHRFHMIVGYMELGRWMKDHGFRDIQRKRDRIEVFDHVARIVGDKRVLYLEFGVHQGASMRYWSKALKHPEAILHGFDSFEGLPETWDLHGPHKKGTFDTGGAVPQIDDPRVRFFKGWFDQVLPAYRLPGHDVLVVTLDADLYSSTTCVLQHLREWIKPGTYLYFDDLSRPEHEARAFGEFMQETGKTFRILCADQSLNTAFFECIG